MEDLYNILQVAPGADREAIQAAYERLKSLSGGVATADLDHAYQTLSNPQRRRVYDNARMDPRSLRALFNVEGRQEKVVWNIEGRRGEEPPPPAAPLDPWGLDRRNDEQPFDGEIELIDPLEEEAESAYAFSSVEAVAVADETDEPEVPGQETLPWDEPVEAALEQETLDAVREELIEPAPLPQPLARPAQPKPPAASRPKKKRPARKAAARATPPSKNGKQPARASAKKAAQDSRRHARTAASQLLTPEPVDLEAVTLTSYNPDDYVQEKPPSWWNPINLFSLFSFVLFTAAAVGGVYYVWDGSREGDDEPGGSSQSESELLVEPPLVVTSAQLPPSLVEFARSYVQGFEGALGERYEYLNLAALALPDGSYFYAAAARDRGSLDGSHQRVFFFLDETSLGPDWPVDSRSLASVRALSDGRIAVVYHAFADGDEACCGSLDNVTVFFSYDGRLASTLTEPPTQIVAR